MGLTTAPSATTAKHEESKQWPQFLAVLSAGLLAVGSGVLASWTTPSIPKLQSNDLGFEVTEDQVSHIVMLEPLGLIIGSAIGGVLLNKLGRKRTLLVIAIPQIIAHLLLSTASNVAMIYVSRIVAGISNGAAYSSLPAYMSEVVEAKVRGSLNAIYALGIAAGQLIIISYGSYVSIKTASFISLIFPLLFILTFIWMPDSPYYLMMKQRPEEARTSLKRLRKMKDVEAELSNITAAVQRQMSEPGQIKDVFMVKSNLKAFIIVIGLRTFQQFSGMTVMGYYNQVIFDQAEGSLSPAQSSIIVTAIRFLAVNAGLHLVDTVGRKLYYIVTILGSSITITLLGVYFNFLGKGYDMSSITWFPIVGMALYLISTAGLLIIPTLMAGEILSVKIKSRALSMANMYLGLSIVGTSRLFQWLEDDFGMDTPLFFFGVCGFIGAVFCYAFVPETKGKTLEEIQQILKRSKTQQKQKKLDSPI